MVCSWPQSAQRLAENNYSVQHVAKRLYNKYRRFTLGYWRRLRHRTYGHAHHAVYKLVSKFNHFWNVFGKNELWKVSLQFSRFYGWHWWSLGRFVSYVCLHCWAFIKQWPVNVPYDRFIQKFIKQVRKELQRNWLRIGRKEEAKGKNIEELLLRRFSKHEVELPWMGFKTTYLF